MLGDIDILKDRILLEKACKEGCTASLTVIYGRYRQEICAYLHKAGANGMAEDICQSVFLAIQGGKCNYDGSSEVGSYLKGVARNLFRQHLSYCKIKTCAVGIEGRASVLQDTPEKVLTDTETAKELEERISKLPSKSREAIKLVYIDGIPARQAAQIAKCDLKIFCDRLGYGLRCLKNMHKCK